MVLEQSTWLQPFPLSLLFRTRRSLQVSKGNYFKRARHYSPIIPGLHPESHGVIFNNYFNHKIQNSSNETYISTYGINEWWDNGYEPIWATATEHHLKSGCYLFPGCSASVGGKVATRSVLQEKQDLVNYSKERVDLAFSWMLKENFDFVAVYFEMVCKLV